MATTKKSTGKMEDKYSRFNDDGYGIRPITADFVPWRSSNPGSGASGRKTGGAGKKSGGTGKGGKK